MNTITPELKLAIRESGHTQSTFAPLIGLTRQAFSNKKRGLVSWRLDECYMTLDLLGIERTRITEYFRGRV